MVTDSNSVHEQVTQLCKKILKDEGRMLLHSSDIVIKDLRSISFEILLNKSNKSCIYYGEEDLDAVSKILAYSYRLYQWNSSVQATQLHKLMDKLLNSDVATNPTLQAILLFLASLADETPSSTRITYANIQPFSTVLGTKVKPYLEFMPQVFDAPLIVPTDKSYPFNCEPGKGLSLLTKNNFTSPCKVKWCSQEGINFPDLTRPRNLMIPKVLSLTDHQFKDEGYGSPSQDPSLTSSYRLEPLSSEVWDLAYLTHAEVLRTWESLGSLEPSREKPFLTETSADCVQKIWKSVMGQERLYVNSKRAGNVPYTAVTQEQLIQDIKFLLIGVPSQTFQFNEKEDGFVLRNALCMKGLTPETLQSYCEDFLLAGSCCLRLDKLITANSVQEGLMFQALCSSMRRYLRFYRCAVLKLRESPFLLDLRRQFDGLYIQIISLASLCKVHPQLSGETLPEGVALLAYLYREIQKVTRRDLACILYSVLQACCQVYFSFLQKWMFEGICHDTYSEFFIQERIDLTTNRQREYWSQGHSLFMDAVPGFLHGLEEPIFQCGKALNLLKLCNPQDPLCIILQSGYPTIQCCLHGVELHNMEFEWRSYHLRAHAACGEPLNLPKLLYQSREDELSFQAAVQASQMERQRILKLEKEMERAAVVSMKNKQLAILKEQIQQAREMRAKERRERKEEEERIAREAREQEEREARLIELEKANLRSHYLHLTEAAEERRINAERLIQQMKNETPVTIISPNNNVNPQELYNNANNDATNDNSNIQQTVIAKNNTDNSIVLESINSGTMLETNNSVNKAILESANNRTNAISNDVLESTDSETMIDTDSTMTTAIEEKILELSRNETDEENGNNVYSRYNVNDSIGKSVTMLNEHHEGNSTTVMSLGNVKCYEEEFVSPKPTSIEMDLEIEDFHMNNRTVFETSRGGSCYTIQMSLGDCPLVNISDNLIVSQRSIVSQVEDAGTTDMSSFSIALQKSILLPLKIQAALVNNALLKLFLEEEELLSHLHSLRNYFFLLDGEFGRNVTSALFDCMYHAVSPTDMLNSVTLNSVLYKSLPQTDPNTDRLRFDIKYTPPHFTFSSPLSLDCIILQYKVGWPLNIILTSAALHKYNDVFGFLLRLRRISWVLEEDFHRLKRRSKEIPEILGSPQYHSLQLYRHEMTHFIHAIQSYVTATVLQGSWVEFLKNLQNAHTLDDLYRMHVAYVKMVLFRCLLNKQSAAIQKALVDTLRMVLKFHGQLCSGAWERNPGSSYYQHPKFDTLVQIYHSFHNLAIFIFKFASKLANTGYQPHLYDLLQMLNMNNFYP